MGTALSNTTTLTFGSTSSALTIAFNCGIDSGPKMLNGGLSMVTRQYSGVTCVMRNCGLVVCWGAGARVGSAAAAEPANNIPAASRLRV